MCYNLCQTRSPSWDKYSKGISKGPVHVTSCKNIAVFADHSSYGPQQRTGILIDTCRKPTSSQVGLQKVLVWPIWAVFPPVISPCHLYVTINPRIKGLVCCFTTRNLIPSHLIAVSFYCWHTLLVAWHLTAIIIHLERSKSYRVFLQKWTLSNFSHKIPSKRNKHLHV